MRIQFVHLKPNVLRQVHFVLYRKRFNDQNENRQN